MVNSWDEEDFNALTDRMGLLTFEPGEQVRSLPQGVAPTPQTRADADDAPPDASAGGLVRVASFLPQCILSERASS